MKKHDIQKLREKTVSELQAALQQLAEKLAKAKLEKKVGRVTNVRSTGTMADDIARIKTIMREKELAAATQPVKQAAKTAQKVETAPAKKETKKSSKQETSK